MIDRSLRRDESGAALVRLDATAPIAASSWLLPRRVACAATVIAGLGAALYLYKTEGGGAGLFATAAMGTIGALLVVIFRRVLPAVVLVIATIAIIRTASYAKQQS